MLYFEMRSFFQRQHKRSESREVLAGRAALLYKGQRVSRQMGAAASGDKLTAILKITAHVLYCCFKTNNLYPCDNL